MGRLDRWRNSARELTDNPNLFSTWVKDKAERISAGLKSNKARVLVIVAFILLALWAVTLNHYHLVIGHSNFGLWATTFLVSVGPELAGIVIGVVTIDYLNERRQDRQLKEQLILQLGSHYRDVTDTAIRALRARGWLEDGSLDEARLLGANLSKAGLEGARLRGALLTRANLNGAILCGADLRGARLGGANLRNAIMPDVDLQNANLLGANLEGASPWRCNLKESILCGVNFTDSILEQSDLNGADLREANLSGAKVTAAQLSEAGYLSGATMPDGTMLRNPDPIVYEPNPDGPTFEEWLIMQESQVDKQSLVESTETVSLNDEEG